MSCPVAGVMGVVIGTDIEHGRGLLCGRRARRARKRISLSSSGRSPGPRLSLARKGDGDRGECGDRRPGRRDRDGGIPVAGTAMPVTPPGSEGAGARSPGGPRRRRGDRGGVSSGPRRRRPAGPVPVYRRTRQLRGSVAVSGRPVRGSPGERGRSRAIRFGPPVAKDRAPPAAWGRQRRSDDRAGRRQAGCTCPLGRAARPSGPRPGREAGYIPVAAMRMTAA